MAPELQKRLTDFINTQIVNICAELQNDSNLLLTLSMLILDAENFNKDSKDKDTDSSTTTAVSSPTVPQKYLNELQQQISSRQAKKSLKELLTLIRHPENSPVVKQITSEMYPEGFGQQDQKEALLSGVVDCAKSAFVQASAILRSITIPQPCQNEADSPVANDASTPQTQDDIPYFGMSMAFIQSLPDVTGQQDAYPPSSTADSAPTSASRPQANEFKQKLGGRSQIFIQSLTAIARQQNAYPASSTADSASTSQSQSPSPVANSTTAPKKDEAPGARKSPPPKPPRPVESAEHYLTSLLIKAQNQIVSFEHYLKAFEKARTAPDFIQAIGTESMQNVLVKFRQSACDTLDLHTLGVIARARSFDQQIQRLNDAKMSMLFAPAVVQETVVQTQKESWLKRHLFFAKTAKKSEIPEEIKLMTVEEMQIAVIKGEIDSLIKQLKNLQKNAAKLQYFTLPQDSRLDASDEYQENTQPSKP